MPFISIPNHHKMKIHQRTSKGKKLKNKKLLLENTKKYIINIKTITVQTEKINKNS